MSSIAGNGHKQAAAAVREAIAVYNRARDLVDIGAYAPGSNPEIDRALALMPKIKAFLQQPPEEATPFEETVSRLIGILEC
jgi:flagellar biosynthesis/type III secretory pathway ATPase